MDTRLSWGSCYNADSGSVGLRWTPRFCISKKLSCAADAADCGPYCKHQDPREFFFFLVFNCQGAFKRMCAKDKHDRGDSDCPFHEG